MGVSDALAARAIELVEEEADHDDALRVLYECSLGKRVAVVIAKQKLSEDPRAASGEGGLDAAILLLDDTIQRSRWT